MRFGRRTLGTGFATLSRLEGDEYVFDHVQSPEGRSNPATPSRSRKRSARAPSPASNVWSSTTCSKPTSGPRAPRWSRPATSAPRVRRRRGSRHLLLPRRRGPRGRVHGVGGHPGRPGEPVDQQRARPGPGARPARARGRAPRDVRRHDVARSREPDRGRLRARPAPAGGHGARQPRSARRRARAEPGDHRGRPDLGADRDRRHRHPAGAPGRPRRRVLGAGRPRGHDPGRRRQPPDRGRRHAALPAPREPLPQRRRARRRPRHRRGARRRALRRGRRARLDDAGIDVFAAGRTTAANGTGFGLAIVEEIATAHG